MKVFIYEIARGINKNGERCVWVEQASDMRPPRREDIRNVREIGFVQKIEDDKFTLKEAWEAIKYRVDQAVDEGDFW